MIPLYVNDIKNALKNNCYFSALSLALALPDICGSVEFPDKSVTERYIAWYDLYIGQFLSEDNKYDNDQSPWMSGELVYNLRNTYLHQGLPTINSSKVKEDTNRLDKFALVLGDGSFMNTLAIRAEVPNKNFSYKIIMVDISYLCNLISDCALWFFENNKGKFSFDFTLISQNDFKRAMSEDPGPQESLNDTLKKILNKFVEEKGENWRFI